MQREAVARLGARVRGVPGVDARFLLRGSVMFAERLKQADNLLTQIQRVRAAGYALIIEPTGVIVCHSAHEPRVYVGRELRDALAHAVMPIVFDLDAAADERRDLANRLINDTEPLHSPERDLREPEVCENWPFPCDCAYCENRARAELSHDSDVHEEL